MVFYICFYIKTCYADIYQILYWKKRTVMNAFYNSIKASARGYSKFLCLFTWKSRKSHQISYTFFVFITFLSLLQHVKIVNLFSIKRIQSLEKFRLKMCLCVAIELCNWSIGICFVEDQSILIKAILFLHNYRNWQSNLIQSTIEKVII